MKKIAITILSAVLLAVAFLLGVIFGSNEQLYDQQGSSQLAQDDSDPDIRTELFDDGSRSLWIRSEDKARIDQYLFSAGGNLLAKKEFRIGADGNPLRCRIYDDTKTELFKIRYGYRKADGILVEEQVFDSTVKDGEEEIPLRRVLHTYSSDSTESKTISIDAESTSLPNNIVTAFHNPFISE